MAEKALATYVKDPDAKLDYAIDWTLWLAESETITDSDWTVATGLTEESNPAPSIDDGITTVWLSGGTLNTTYRVTNHITTSQGRQDDRTITIHVNDR